MLNVIQFTRLMNADAGIDDGSARLQITGISRWHLEVRNNTYSNEFRLGTMVNGIWDYYPISSQEFQRLACRLPVETDEVHWGDK